MKIDLSLPRLILEQLMELDLLLDSCANTFSKTYSLMEGFRHPCTCVRIIEDAHFVIPTYLCEIKCLVFVILEPRDDIRIDLRRWGGKELAIVSCGIFEMSSVIVQFAGNCGLNFAYFSHVDISVVTDKLFIGKLICEYADIFIGNVYCNQHFRYNVITHKIGYDHLSGIIRSARVVTACEHICGGGYRFDKPSKEFVIYDVYGPTQPLTIVKSRAAVKIQCHRSLVELIIDIPAHIHLLVISGEDCDRIIIRNEYRIYRIVCVVTTNIEVQGMYGKIIDSAYTGMSILELIGDLDVSISQRCLSTQRLLDFCAKIDPSCTEISKS